ncbi:hypothetical protein P4O66_010651, partial [Electrophorus voltai]
MAWLLDWAECASADGQYLCYICTAISINLLLAVAIGYRFARWPCVVLFFRLRGYVERKLGRKWRRNRRARQRDRQLDVDEKVKYDAFVSFSSHDEAWVMGELALSLDRQGHPTLHHHGTSGMR